MSETPVVNEPTKEITPVVPTPVTEPVQTSKPHRVTHKDMGDKDSIFEMSQGYPVGQ